MLKHGCTKVFRNTCVFEKFSVKSSFDLKLNFLRFSFDIHEEFYIYSFAISFYTLSLFFWLLFFIKLSAECRKTKFLIIFFLFYNERVNNRRNMDKQPLCFFVYFFFRLFICLLFLYFFLS